MNLTNKGSGPHQRKSYPRGLFNHGTWQQVQSKMEEGVSTKAPSHSSNFNYKSQDLGRGCFDLGMFQQSKPFILPNDAIANVLHTFL